MFCKNCKKFIEFIIIIVFIFLLYSCQLYTFGQFVANEPGSLNPKWDLDFDINILDKRISLEEYLENITIDTFDAEVPNLAQWPILGGTDPEFPTLSEDIDISTVNKYDFDNDGTIDFLIKGIRSTTTTFDLIVWLTLTGDATILPLTSANGINLNSVTIEGVAYTFNPPSIDAQGRLVYKPNNFLDPGYDYYLNFGNDPANNIDQLNVSSVDVHLVPATGVLDYPAYGFPGYSLHVQAVFDVGTDFGVVGEIVNNPLIQGLNEVQDIPLINSSSNYEGINQLDFNFIFENNTPFIINIQEVLSSTSVTPVPDTYTTQILSGNLVQHSNYAGYNNYWYAASEKTSTGKIELKNISQYDDLTMDMFFNLEIYTDGRNILFTPSRSVLKAKLNVQGEVTVAF